MALEGHCECDPALVIELCGLQAEGLDLLSVQGGDLRGGDLGCPLGVLGGTKFGNRELRHSNGLDCLRLDYRERLDRGCRERGRLCRLESGERDCRQLMQLVARERGDDC